MVNSFEVCQTYLRACWDKHISSQSRNFWQQQCSRTCDDVIQTVCLLEEAQSCSSLETLWYPIVLCPYAKTFLSGWENKLKKEANSMRIKATSRKCLNIKYCAKVIQKIIVDLAIITSREVIIAGSQSFKMAATRFVKVVNARKW